LKPRVIQ